MGFKSKKYYFNQIKDTYVFAKKILGAIPSKNHIYKNKVEFFDGYMKFAFFNGITEEDKKILLELNNKFDDIWNKYHHMILYKKTFFEENKLDIKTHIFYILILICAIIANIILMIKIYYASLFLIVLGILIFIIPLLLYLFKIIINVNKEKIIIKGQNKMQKKLEILKNEMKSLLQLSPLYDNEDLSLFLNDEVNLSEIKKEGV